MIPSEVGTTDVMSSLPLIGCCIVAVMVLIAAIGQSASRGAHDDAEHGLDASCHKLMSGILGPLTWVADDGLRYLAKDWSARITGLKSTVAPESGSSSCIVVRVINSGESAFSISGNISLCRDVRTLSEPVLLIDGNDREPGELIAMVGA